MVRNLAAHADAGKRPSGLRSTRQRYIDSLSITVYDGQDFLGNAMPTLSKDRLHGTLDALVLKTLSWGPRHGYAIARWLEEKTGDAIQVEEGSLYPALYRMEKRGWIEAAWGMSEIGRKAKIYRLTGAGRKQLRLETAEWTHFASAVSRILKPDAGP